MSNLDVITLKLGGPRQLDAADWMLGKPTPDEVDEEGRDWDQLGVSIKDGVLSIPAHRLADFIEEMEDGIIVTLNSAGTPEDDIDARAVVRAMETIIERLRSLEGTTT